MAQAPLVRTAFPAGYCWPSSPDQFAADLYSLSYANVQDNVQGVVYGPTEPGATFKLWYNSTVHRLYEWSADIGRRIAPYWPPANQGIKVITEDTEIQIAAWDNPGGPSASAGAEEWTGPFWEIDHAYDGRFVMGPGGFPIIVRTVPLATSGGVDAIVQEPNQVGIHRHFITMGTEPGAESYLPPQPAENGEFIVGGGSSLHFFDEPDTLVGRTREGGGDGEEPNIVHPMDNIPPYRAAWIIKRTARIYYTL